MPQKILKALNSAADSVGVILVPDSHFFVRRVPVAPGSPDEIVSQVELALEGFSPFPLPQLFYGFYLPEGASQALVFAAFRKRFSAEETDAWARADFVLPAFATALGWRPSQPGAVLIDRSDSITVLVWDEGSVPALVLSRQVEPEADSAARLEVAKGMLARAGKHSSELTVLQLAGTAEQDPRSRQLAFTFESGDSERRLVSALPVGLAERLDVREKEQLAARRREEGRNRLLWRTLVGAVAALIVACIAEIGLLAGGLLVQARERVVQNRAAPVQAIVTADALADRIDELGTKRLLPFEMLDAINQARPQSISFTQVNTDGLYTLQVQGETQNSLDVDSYRAQLSGLPGVADVEAFVRQIRDGQATFTLNVTFQPEALRPETASVDAGPAQS